MDTKKNVVELSVRDLRRNLKAALEGEAAVVATNHRRPRAVLIPLPGYTQFDAMRDRKAIAAARRAFAAAITRLTQ